MKALIAILLIVGAIWGGYRLLSYWVVVKADKKEAPAEVQPASGSQLPGLPPTLEGPLQAAQQKGATGLKIFLVQYGKTISDPRLASLELDYVVLVARENPTEAKKVFAKVKQRTTSSSPVYERIKQLEKTYE
jgi:hypothetical protein